MTSVLDATGILRTLPLKRGIGEPDARIVQGGELCDAALEHRVAADFEPLAVAFLRNLQC
ncbi:MAG: hypothetical protein ACRYG8_17125 [Janthinobacterium lividum]